MINTGEKNKNVNQFAWVIVNFFASSSAILVALIFGALVVFYPSFSYASNIDSQYIQDDGLSYPLYQDQEVGVGVSCAHFNSLNFHFHYNFK